MTIADDQRQFVNQILAGLAGDSDLLLRLKRTVSADDRRLLDSLLDLTREHRAPGDCAGGEHCAGLAVTATVKVMTRDTVARLLLALLALVSDGGQS